MHIINTNGIFPGENLNKYFISVDGSWGTWSSWGSCSATCGGGSQRRTRECDNPAPAAGGSECPGSGEEVLSCNTETCPLVLIGGNGVSSGNVFVINRNGFYGPVCDDGWTLTEATVLCRYKGSL